MAAEVKRPYVVDEKPQALFGDSIATSTYYGLENYAQNYVGGFAHLSYTYTHAHGSYASYPPTIFVSDVDPRTTSSYTLKSVLGLQSFGAEGATDWYLVDVQFDAGGFSFSVKEAGQTEVFYYYQAVSGLRDSDWIFLANQYPFSDPPSPYSMSFTPFRLPAEAPAKIISADISTSTLKVSLHIQIPSKDADASVGFIIKDESGVEIWSAAPQAVTVAGESDFTFDFPDLTLYDQATTKIHPYLFTFSISKNAGVLDSVSKTVPISSPVEGHPGYYNLTGDGVEIIESSYNHLLQTLGTGLSGTLTQIDLKTSNPSALYYGSSPLVNFFECPDSNYGNSFLNGSGCEIIYSGMSGSGSGLHPAVQSFYTPPIIFNPAKYYFLYTKGSNQFDSLPYYYGSVSDVVSDGACYQYHLGATIHIDPCTGLSDLYFYLRGVSKSAPLPPTKLEPVIIVPGIAGSELKNGDDLIWLNIGRMFSDTGDQFLTDNLMLNSEGNSTVPTVNFGNVIEDAYLANVQVVNTFKGLDDGLVVEGYVLGSSLFFFPYDWRLNLDNTRTLLKQKIDEVKAQTGADRVNIIAHSMGGLLVKDYLKEFGKDSIDKLIFVGTPHLGAPKAGKILFAGDNFDIPWLTPDRIKEVAVNSPAVYELLPNQTYFSNFGGYIKPYKFLSNTVPYNYFETKNYLLEQNLNSGVFTQAENFFAENLQEINLSGIAAYNIAGCKVNTQSAYQIGIFGEIGSVGYSTGDGTVPLVSADYVNVPTAQKYYVKKIKHMSLPSAEDVRNAIVGILSGNAIATSSSFSNDSSLCGIKGKVLTWRSPVEVHIYDSAGNHAGPIPNNAIEYGIPGVGYEIIGHEKFIYLPTDEGENYRVEATGTDAGTFDLLIGANDNGLLKSTQIFNDVPVTTSTHIEFPVSDTTNDNSIAVDPGTGIPIIVQSSATVFGDDGDDIVPPETATTTVGVAGLNGWYKSDVKVTLTPTDDNSGVLETKYSLDAGLTFSAYTVPVTISKEGTTEFRYFSVDKAGNNEIVKSFQIKIDKTSPETTLQFDTGTKTFVFQPEISSSSSCTKTKCTISDQSGNTTVLQFAQLKILTSYTLTLQSIAYNGVTQKFSGNGLVVIFEEKNGKIKKFVQTLLVKNQEISVIDYNSSKDQSTIYTLKPDKTRSKQVLPGKKILQIITSNGSLQAVIK